VFERITRCHNADKKRLLGIAAEGMVAVETNRALCALRYLIYLKVQMLVQTFALIFTFIALELDHSKSGDWSCVSCE